MRLSCLKWLILGQTFLNTLTITNCFYTVIELGIWLHYEVDNSVITLSGFHYKLVLKVNFEMKHLFSDAKKIVRVRGSGENAYKCCFFRQSALGQLRGRVFWSKMFQSWKPLFWTLLQFLALLWIIWTSAVIQLLLILYYLKCCPNLNISKCVFRVFNVRVKVSKWLGIA